MAARMQVWRSPFTADFLSPTRWVLSFLRHVDNETLIERVTAYSAEVIPLIRNHTLFSEWNDFVARLEALGVPVEDKQHPLEALEARAEGRSAAPPVVPV